MMMIDDIDIELKAGLYIYEGVWQMVDSWQLIADYSADLIN